MNEAFAPFRRRIDPATEPAFRLGELHVSPATLELSRAGVVETIEPRVMQVLVALHRHAGEAVSRDDLSQLCWGGLIVGDDALNRSISRLRRSLAGEPGVAIDTIPKVGYRLRLLSGEPLAAESGGAAMPARPARAWLRAWSVAAALVIALGALLLWTGRPMVWSAENMRPLTRDTATETFPALSPDGRLVAYAGGGGFGAPRDIYLRGVAVGDTTPLRLTSTAADEMSPVWSRDGGRLAFVRRLRGSPCAIVVMSPPRGAERMVGRCRTDDATALSWLGDEALIFSDRAPGSGPMRLFRLDVASGTVRPITSPAADLVGDAAPVASPDGRYVAFRRTAALGSDDIHLLDLHGRAVRALTFEGWKALGFAWSADSSTLFFSSNRGGDFGLWSLEVNGRAAPQRVSLGLLPFGRMSADGRGQLAVEVSRLRANLASVSASGGVSPITEAAGVDWDPDVAPDGSVVHASDISGTNEIWLKRPGREPVQLSDLRGSYVHSPRWSPDAREIAFIGVRRQATDIYVMNADGSRLRRATSDGAAKGSVAWSGRAAELVYSVRTPAGWRLMRLARAGDLPAPIPGGEGVAVLARGATGALYGRTADDPALRRLDFGTGAVATLNPRIEVPGLREWAPARDGVYWIRDDGRRQAAYWFTAWSGEQRRVAAMPTAPKSDFAVGSDGTLVVPRLIQQDSDLMLLELKRR